MARERHFTSPIFPPLKPTRYECTNCGSALPATGWPKEAFILVEEDQGVPLSPLLLRRYRRRIVGRHHVRTRAAALRFVNAVGFCYAFTSGPGDLPGLFDVLDTRSINRMWSWAWQWKDELASRRRLLYGRLVRRKPTLIALAYVPHFFALSGNVGEPDDYLQAYREGRLALLAKDVYEYLRRHGPCSTWVLRAQFVTGRGPGGALQRALVALQERCLIAKVGESESSFSFIWDTFDRWMPQAVRAAGRVTSEQAAAALLERYLRTVGAASERTAAALFEWPPAIFRQAADAIAPRVVRDTLEGAPALIHRDCLRARR